MMVRIFFLEIRYFKIKIYTLYVRHNAIAHFIEYNRM